MKLSQYEKTIEENQTQMEMLRDEVTTLTEQLRYAESDSAEQESFQQQIQELTEKHMKVLTLHCFYIRNILQDLTSQRQRYEQRVLLLRMHYCSNVLHRSMHIRKLLLKPIWS